MNRQEALSGDVGRSIGDTLVEATGVGSPERPGVSRSWPNGERVIFEAKTVSDSNETSQMRGGLAQLLEYRVEYGNPDDLLCVVVDREISLRRTRLLD